uniref:Uncharacterized protein n=1 Tax=Myoviridae sp. ctrCp2 TaxID=2825179 RepID=A0A8S5NYZ7_9CAUD|nr:MAG TPA: hypothetical protein [Myoviridae sp. ctrCp2]
MKTICRSDKLNMNTAERRLIKDRQRGAIPFLFSKYLK